MQVVIVVEWEACLRADASSRLQLLSAAGEDHCVVGFDSLAVSGKSLTKLHLSASGAVLATYGLCCADYTAALG